ncbi:hypothetical protein [Natrinema versiforme]|uniref:Uncharacterized protein n=1 Tax=Natrinema versiforme JCM 10478 TaxID=1227496 RepID=L9Y6D3_9EURY|nr:hypothetical protein [Natrinema versiforme]ELY69292.1 hypothetical protein C489_05043 [Natrinema versiforme JCM 10478]
MPPYIDEVLFSEPSGRRLALVHCSVSLAFLSMYTYAWSAGDAGSSGWLLFMVVGTALAGIAESLPETRLRAVGVLRSAGILVLLCVVAAPFLDIEFIIGG